MKVSDAKKLLKAIQQEHLFTSWPSFSIPERLRYMRQLEELDLKNNWPFLLNALQDGGPLAQSSMQSAPLTPLNSFQSLENLALSVKEGGQQLIDSGKVGCLVVAGGQGSRLRFDKPKGMFPITAIKKKSLFQLLAEKVLVLSGRANQPLPLAIMTSPQNHWQTKNYFQEQAFFGLDPKQVSFFQQGTLPLLSFDRQLFFEAPGKIAVGPNGNGSALYHLVQSGIYQQWQERGVEYVNFIQIDNPLADPFDATLVGFHRQQQSEVTVKCCLRDDPLEKVGLIAALQDKVSVVEYSELSSEEKVAKLENGTLKYPLANLSLFCFSLPFIQQAASYFQQMPLHIACKAAVILDEQGKSQLSQQPIAYKFEKFIFDVLVLAQKTSVLVYPKERCFAPLKSAVGEGSLSHLQDKLQAHDRALFEAISGQRVPSDISFELAPDFYYPTKELLANWRGRSLPSTPSYIEPYIELSLISTSSESNSK